MKLFPVLLAGLWAGASLAAAAPAPAETSAAAAVVAPGGAWVRNENSGADFPLATQGKAPATVVVAPEDFKVVQIAAAALADDVQRVTGRKPAVRAQAEGVTAPAILVGTLGRSPLIDGLVLTGKFDPGDLAGQWESFVIATVENPVPGVPLGLVIAGSDRRGTAYGVFELAQALGVSPWYWWADVTPAKRDNLYVAAGTRKFGPPSVQYRGIFINDEDWGLQPWAATNFESGAGEAKDLGPKTYAKVFELLLRLKANTLWPAMHPSTKPFNHFAANKQVADDYGIVMGSSHAEPMLRNNVGEWSLPAAQYNYITNRDGVYGYWEERLKTNGQFENIYTLGMRGIHDSNMQGPRTDAERIQTLERIFADQRALLKQYVGNDLEKIPQMFCAYKEVLSLYRQSLQVPDDVTIVWPDDNFGYIRNFASPRERSRAGGFGVYYHISYLGAPLMYLWLCTTPPALIWEEMSKAYDHGAQRIWIANVGDLKPAEIGMEFFLQMAWDIQRWNPETLPQFLPEWAARQFGPAQADNIAAILAEYYRLNYQRKPEHLQWWLPNQSRRASPLTRDEVAARLAAFASLSDRAQGVAAALPKELQDAYFELVLYPVRGSALANDRYFYTEFYEAQPDRTSPAARALAARARLAQTGLNELTTYYNQTLAGGKWDGIIQVEIPRSQWTSMRMAPISLPPDPGPGVAPAPGPIWPATAEVAAPGEALAVEAEGFTAKVDQAGARWVVVPGLGRTGDSVTVLPTTAATIEPENARAEAPRLEYQMNFPRAGEFPLLAYLIPTQPIVAGRGLRFAVALDDAAPRLVTAAVRDGSADWAQSVLNATNVATVNLNVPAPGPHTLKIYMTDAGVVLDKLVVDLGGLRPGYLGPPATVATKQP